MNKSYFISSEEDGQRLNIYLYIVLQIVVSFAEFKYKCSFKLRVLGFSSKSTHRAKLKVQTAAALMGLN